MTNDVHDMTTDAEGRTKCSCGEVSPRMGTTARIVQWQKAHRRKVGLTA